MSLASRTREAARRHPWLVDALAAGVVNYTGAARFLAVEGDTDAVATALRRYAEDLSTPAAETDDATVSMQSGIARREDGDGTDASPVLSVGGEAFVADGGSLTAVVARGTLPPTALRTVLGRFAVADVPVEAAAASDRALTVVVGRRYGADAVRVVEDALSA